MAHELFGQIVDPSIIVGTKKWYTVPLSILAHVAALIGLVVVPLMAIDGLPTPDSLMVFVAPPPPAVPSPPPPARPLDPAVPPVTVPMNPDAAPLDAPTQITDEPPPQRFMPTGVGGGIPPLVSTVGASTLAAAPPPPPRFVRPGGDIKEPRKIRDARPIYPQVAMAAKVEGVVRIEATISKDGSVIDAKVIRSQALLDQAALDAVRQWKFTPTMLNGVPVEVIMTVTVNFTLH
jgi:protein TonB